MKIEIQFNSIKNLPDLSRMQKVVAARYGRKKGSSTGYEDI